MESKPKAEDVNMGALAYRASNYAPVVGDGTADALEYVRSDAKMLRIVQSITSQVRDFDPAVSFHIAFEHDGESKSTTLTLYTRLGSKARKVLGNYIDQVTANAYDTIGLPGVSFVATIE